MHMRKRMLHDMANENKSKQQEYDNEKHHRSENRRHENTKNIHVDGRHNSYNEISQITQEEYGGKRRSNSYPKTHKSHEKRDLPMFYLTLASSSAPGSSNSESPEFKRKHDTSKNKSIEGGAMFQCQELDGGNAIELVYPFLHVASDPKDMLQAGTIPSSIVADLAIQRMIKGAYTTLEIVYCLPEIWSRSGVNVNENKGDIFMTSHVIFNGLKVNDNPKPKRLETLELSWRDWSKVGLLSKALLQAGIMPDRIHFLKLVSPKNFSYFMYCVLVSVDLPLQKDEVKCLNVIQEVRGKTVPGYLTLFQRCTSSLSDLKYSREDSLTSFERLVDSVGDLTDGDTAHRNSQKTSKRSRTVSTI